MFPRGVPGLALVLLRVLVAVTFVVDGSAHITLVTSIPMLLLFSIPALFVCLGLLTPYFASFCILAQFVILSLVGSADPFHFGTAGMMSGVLALLGPGAYSLDALIFGRQRLNFPPT